MANRGKDHFIKLRENHKPKSGTYENIVIATDENGRELAFSSYKKMAAAIPEMRWSTLSNKKKPCHYKGYYIRKVKFNPI